MKRVHSFFNKYDNNYVDSDKIVKIEDGVAIKLDDVIDAHKAEMATQFDSKVGKIEGKGLSTNDYDNVEKSEVAKVKNKADKIYVDTTKDNLNSRIDNIIATPTTVSEQEIIDARQGAASLGANIAALKEDYATQVNEWLSVLTLENEAWEVV